jgi:hypothetical protein
MVSPDSQAIACPLSGRNSTYRTVQISGTGSQVIQMTAGLERVSLDADLQINVNNIENSRIAD